MSLIGPACQTSCKVLFSRIDASNSCSIYMKMKIKDVPYVEVMSPPNEDEERKAWFLELLEEKAIPYHILNCLCC